MYSILRNLIIIREVEPLILNMRSLHDVKKSNCTCEGYYECIRDVPQKSKVMRMMATSGMIQFHFIGTIKPFFSFLYLFFILKHWIFFCNTDCCVDVSVLQASIADFLFLFFFFVSLFLDQQQGYLFLAEVVSML